jgi:hypothetical protein
MLQTAAIPGGLPMEVFDGIRANILADSSQFFHCAVLRRQPAGRHAEDRFGRAALVVLDP